MPISIPAMSLFSAGEEVLVRQLLCLHVELVLGVRLHVGHRLILGRIEGRHRRLGRSVWPKGDFLFWRPLGNMGAIHCPLEGRTPDVNPLEISWPRPAEPCRAHPPGGGDLGQYCRRGGTTPAHRTPETR